MTFMEPNLLIKKCIVSHVLNIIITISLFYILGQMTMWMIHTKWSTCFQIFPHGLCEFYQKLCIPWWVFLPILWWIYLYNLYKIILKLLLHFFKIEVSETQVCCYNILTCGYITLLRCNQWSHYLVFSSPSVWFWCNL